MQSRVVWQAFAALWEAISVRERRWRVGLGLTVMHSWLRCRHRALGRNSTMVNALPSTMEPCGGGDRSMKPRVKIDIKLLSRRREAKLHIARVSIADCALLKRAAPGFFEVFPS